MRAALALILSATPGLAQDLAFDPGIADSCRAASLQAEERRPDCVGNAATHCTDMHPNGSTTLVMNACLGLERDWWDARLNDNYRSLRSIETAAGGPAAAALARMQKAWVAYRDAACDYAAAPLDGGTGATTERIACLMQETAAQAMLLDLTLAQVKNR